jgi:hypothetical protein
MGLWGVGGFVRADVRGCGAACACRGQALPTQRGGAPPRRAGVGLVRWVWCGAGCCSARVGLGISSPADWDGASAAGGPRRAAPRPSWRGAGAAVAPEATAPWQAGPRHGNRRREGMAARPPGRETRGGLDWAGRRCWGGGSRVGPGCGHPLGRVMAAGPPCRGAEASHVGAALGAGCGCVWFAGLEARPRARCLCFGLAGARPQRGRGARRPVERVQVGGRYLLRPPPAATARARCRRPRAGGCGGAAFAGGGVCASAIKMGGRGQGLGSRA